MADRMRVISFICGMGTIKMVRGTRRSGLCRHGPGFPGIANHRSLKATEGLPCSKAKTPGLRRESACDRRERVSRYVGADSTPPPSSRYNAWAERNRGELRRSKMRSAALAKRGLQRGEPA